VKAQIFQSQIFLYFYRYFLENPLGKQNSSEANSKANSAASADASHAEASPATEESTARDRSTNYRIDSIQ
jgi:hypothetical protein